MRQKKKVSNILPATYFKNTNKVIVEYKQKDTSTTSQKKPETIEEKLDKVKKNTSVSSIENKKNIGLSIKSLKKKKEELKKQKQNNNFKNLPKDPFTQTQFEVFWNKYLNILRKHHEKNFLSILTIDKNPRVIDNKIHITLTSTVLKDELIKNKEKVLNYLREHLNNYEIDFEISINEQKKEELIYTKSDKFKKLLQKNPDLRYLKDKFNLDF